MAKTYQAVRDVSIPKPVSLLDPNKPDGDWVVEGATYPAGAIISEEWLTPRDRKRAEDGELDHLLQPSDEELPEGYVTGGVFNEPERGVFIAEHEAEATALEAAGHIVVNNDQKMELLSSSAAHQAGYQQAVKDHGFDKRPTLDHLQQPRPRVPDELLLGGETPTGLPHHRGREGDQQRALEYNRENAENNAGEDSDEGSTEPVRAAPGSTQSNEGGPQTADPQVVGSEQ